MLQEQVTALEKRADILEGKLGKGAAAAGGADAATLPRLEQLRKLIEEDRVEAETIRAQKNELEEENEKLKKEVEKLNYRIKHLNRTIDEMEQKQGKLPPPTA